MSNFEDESSQEDPNKRQESEWMSRNEDYDCEEISVVRYRLGEDSKQKTKQIIENGVSLTFEDYSSHLSSLRCFFLVENFYPT